MSSIEGSQGYCVVASKPMLLAYFRPTSCFCRILSRHAFDSNQHLPSHIPAICESYGNGHVRCSESLVPIIMIMDVH
jgi:hypothetical protein